MLHIINLNLSEISDTLKEFIAFVVFVALNAVLRWVQSKGWRLGVKNGVDNIAAKISAMEQTLDTVKHEFEINGGRTVKAAIIDLRDTVDQLRDIQTAHATIQMNACDFPIFKCDRLGNWTFANEVLVDLFGAPYQELMKRKWLELIPNVEDRLRVFKNFQACAADDIPFREDIPFKNYNTERIFLCDVRANAFRGRPSGSNESPVLFYYGRLEVLKEVTHEHSDA